MSLAMAVQGDPCQPVSGALGGLSESQGEQDQPRAGEYWSLILHKDARAQITPQSRSILPARFPSTRQPDIYNYYF